MEFRLPELGEGVYEGELTGWLVKPGDTVKRGQSLLEVMTDKATMEVPAPFAGTIGEPGSREFYLQARAGTRTTTVGLEKQQVAALAERIEELLD